MATSHTIKVLPLEFARARELFEDEGFIFIEPPPAHTVFSAKGVTCNAALYGSGKLLLQGKGADEFRALWLGHESVDARPFAEALAMHPNPPPACWIGTDEAGKGDWLGPLVVAGVALDRKHVDLVYELGVDDSKKLDDRKLPEMARNIATLGPWDVLVINPPKYNELYARIGNLNKLLAWAHGKVIENLIEQGAPAEWILVDRFATGPTLSRALGPRGRALPLMERPKAESDPAVAAASVLARASYLKQLARLGERFGSRLHGGAGPPALAAGRAFAAAHGEDALGEVAKLHFASTAQALGRA